MKGIVSIKKNTPVAKIADFTTVGGALPELRHAGGIVQDPIFDIQSSTADKFRFHLKAANGQIIAVSQSYLDCRQKKALHRLRRMLRWQKSLTTQ